jgi:hypothetical protein
MDSFVKFYCFFSIKLLNIWSLFRRNKTLSADIVKDLQRILKNMGARADEIVPTTQDC